MCCKSFWKKTVPFILAFILSFYVVSFTEQLNFVNKNQEENISQILESSETKVFLKKELGSGISGTGSSSNSKNSQKFPCFACNDGQFEKPSNKFQSNDKSKENLDSKTEKVKFISKPRAEYTDEARKNQIQGIVRLRVTLSANGEVENIVPVAGLPFGLINQAAIAASQIKFKPAVRNGKSISTTVTIEYNFTIY